MIHYVIRHLKPDLTLDYKYFIPTEMIVLVYLINLIQTVHSIQPFRRSIISCEDLRRIPSVETIRKVLLS